MCVFVCVHALYSDVTLCIPLCEQTPLHSEGLYLEVEVDPSSWTTWVAVGQRPPSCPAPITFNRPATIRGMRGYRAQVTESQGLLHVNTTPLLHSFLLFESLFLS